MTDVLIRSPCKDSDTRRKDGLVKMETEMRVTATGQEMLGLLAIRS